MTDHDKPMSMVELSPIDRRALEFLTHGPDTIGVIDSEEKLAAALVFVRLKDRGLAIASIGDNGPTYRITSTGRAALTESK